MSIYQFFFYLFIYIFALNIHVLVSKKKNPLNPSFENGQSF